MPIYIISKTDGYFGVVADRCLSLAIFGKLLVKDASVNRKCLLPTDA